ncbi:hypothetical protein JCM10207_006630 [Rhodosporidiobolus poonsookiae]
MRVLKFAVFASTAFFLHATAHPDLNLLSPLASSLSASPLFALQTGLAHFSGVLSPSLYALLTSRLAVFPARSANLLTPLQKAFAAANLAVSDAGKATLNDVQACLTDILNRGGIPTGYACVTSGKNTASRYQTAANTIVEQFVGIVPPSTLTLIQNDFNSYFSSLGLIPPVTDLNTHVQNVLASVVASTSGETVTAIERLQDCLDGPLSSPGAVPTSYQCFTDLNGATGNLANVFHGALQQFVGYLPPNVVQDITNIYSYYLSAADAVPGYKLTEPLNRSLLSVTAAVSGNAVTAAQQLAQCFTDLAMQPTETARTSYACLVGSSGPVMTTQVLVNGVIQQGFGYLPPTLVLQLEQQLRPLLLSTPLPTLAPDLVSSAFAAAFRATDAGPESVTCALALEDCLNEVVGSGVGRVCELGGKCKALVRV